jgi:hypothetical protein
MGASSIQNAGKGMYAQANQSRLYKAAAQILTETLRIQKRASLTSEWNDPECLKRISL